MTTLCPSMIGVLTPTLEPIVMQESGGGGGPQPTFRADFSTPGVLDGFTSAVGLTLAQFSAGGFYEYTPQNLAANSFSDGLTTAPVWSPAATHTPGQPDPEGGNGAVLVQGNLGDQTRWDNPFIGDGFYRIRLSLRMDAPDVRVVLNTAVSDSNRTFHIDGAGTVHGNSFHDYSVEDLGGGWWRVTLTHDHQNQSTPTTSRIVTLTNVVNGDYWIHKMQLSRLPTPDVFIETSGTPVYTARTGAYTPDGQGPMLHAETKGRTNLIPYSSDITQWSIGNNLTVALDAIGITGLPDTASTLSVLGGEQGSAFSLVTVVADTNQIAGGCRVKRTGTDQQLEIKLYTNAVNSLAATLNTATGTVLIDVDNAASSDYAVILRNIDGVEWWEVNYTIANDSRAVAVLWVGWGKLPRPEPGSVVIDACGIYQTAFADTASALSLIVGSSPVLTQGATLTQVPDLMVRTSNITQADEGFEVSFITPSDIGNSGIVLGLNNNKWYLAGVLNDEIVFRDGTQNTIAGSLIPAGIQKDYTVTYGTADCAVALNGVVTQGLYDGDLSNSPVYLAHRVGPAQHVTPPIFFKAYAEYAERLPL